jgi:hypothetical protein
MKKLVEIDRIIAEAEEEFAGLNSRCSTLLEQIEGLKRQRESILAGRLQVPSAKVLINSFGISGRFWFMRSFLPLLCSRFWNANPSHKNILFFDGRQFGRAHRHSVSWPGRSATTAEDAYVER